MITLRSVARNIEPESTEPLPPSSGVKKKSTRSAAHRDAKPANSAGESSAKGAEAKGSGKTKAAKGRLTPAERAKGPPKVGSLLARIGITPRRAFAIAALGIPYPHEKFEREIIKERLVVLHSEYRFKVSMVVEGNLHDGDVFAELFEPAHDFELSKGGPYRHVYKSIGNYDVSTGVFVEALEWYASDYDTEIDTTSKLDEAWSELNVAEAPPVAVREHEAKAAKRRTKRKTTT